jgi:hypothetical protein
VPRVDQPFRVAAKRDAGWRSVRRTKPKTRRKPKWNRIDNSPSSVLADVDDDSMHEWGMFASTTEALTVTILVELLRRASLEPELPSGVPATFDAVYAAALDHWNFIRQHFLPSTKQFWIPDGFFGGASDALDLMAVGKGVSGGETLFVNTYLVGVTTAARAGRSDWAPYSAAAAGVESEHRVLGQTLAGSPLTTSVTSRPRSRAPVSASGGRARAPDASTISRTLQWRRQSRSNRTNRNRVQVGPA